MKRNLGVRNVIQETSDTITIEFERPSDVDFKAGQFLTLINDVNGKEERRSYSLCSAPYEKDRLAVSVKRVNGGVVSNYLNDKASSLQSMEVMDPLGAFYLDSNPANSKHYVLFGGGSGITPIMSILKTILEEEPNSVVTLVDQNRNAANIIFRHELNELATKFSERFNIINYLSQPEEGWTGNTGRINAEEVNKIVNNLEGNLTRAYYMCGPDGYMGEVKAGLDLAGVPSEVIFKESFNSSTEVGADSEAAQNAAEGGTKNVKIIFDGDEYNFPVAPGETILDAGLDREIDLPYSCQSGVCTACRGKCLSGEVDLSEVEGLSEKELKGGYVLPCVGYPLTDDVVIEIG